ncbi:SEC-C metal-binding domain-containing protein [Flavobacterium sp. LB2P84]|uniref:YecA family protein n=1 Tax=Flavobacterium yafengii TaxID=3041253 RepID=UPI0024A98890|nr:SEC-C metal-binding domain-containing protein [Flavobacterium yafengii]MDI6032405.1 SEC-C metal-binding domain-containing protein [Flavobacterium yafengii]
MKQQKYIEELSELVKSSGFLSVITKIFFNDFLGTTDTLFNKNVFEHLNHNEYCFLIGLWLKCGNTDDEVEADIMQQMEMDTYEIMEKLHNSFLEDYYETRDENTSLYERFTHGGMLKEAMFYSSDGAYDLQYLSLVNHKFAYDKEWLKLNKDLDLLVSELFYKNIATSLEKKINQLRIKQNLPYYQQLLDSVCLSKEEITNNEKSFENLLLNLVIDVKQANNVNLSDLGDFNVFKEKPILKLAPNKYFIPSLFAISESLYESPFYWMILDKNYSSKALHNRGEVAEEMTKNILLKIFPESSVFQNIVINKTKNDQITDIDILALSGNSGIIFQIKSKKLTSLSKNGNLDAIKKDFKAAIEDAFKQGLLAKKHLLNPEEFIFNCINSNFSIKDLSNIKEYFIVTIVLENYPALTHQSHVMLGANNSELPVTLNIFDLDILVKYLNSPSALLDYISKRVKFSQKYKAENEMGYLAYHMKHGLTEPDGDIIGLDHSWGQSIDKIHYLEKYKKKIEHFQTKKFGRNDPCPCRSGLKFKKCCGKV